jgi:hypothetical protein
VATLGYKITFEFATIQDLNLGWSESFWNNNGTLAGAINAIQPVQLARMNLCPPSITNTFIRVSAYPFGSRLAAVLNVSKNQNWYDNGQYGSNATQSGWVKGLMRLVGSSGAYTRQWLGGIPDNVTNNQAQYVSSPAFKAALSAFFGALATNGFCVKKQLETAPNVKFRIVSVSAAGVFSVPNNTFGTSGSVTITGIPKGFGLRGTWPIATNDGSNVTLLGITPPGVIVPGNRKSFAQLQGYGLTPIATNGSLLSQNFLLNVIQRVTKHNVGRVFGQPSGRRKKLVT